ncbi:outer membrane beta-barrel protein [Tenacibaculum tangerinum]|uniref:Outer membrane beta-barrel protein n=1 Tax=Tenacibaculum tangerinum TaxID=3038772 RepID=A0ABY8L6T7_9FLAO|nr:outer membrane beta-barrel protein [Tenacibaculum tangerinum]
MKEESKNKWNLSVVGGINYLNSITKGSSIDKNLENNSIDHNFSYNFGVYLNYDANEKFSFRVGIHKLQMNYRTTRILIEEPQIQLGSLTQINGISTQYTGTINSIFNNDSHINITQKIIYIEVPTELKYRLKNNHNYKLDLIAGYSTLFLQNNSIYGDSNNTKKFKIGTTDNVSKVNLSMNLGISNQFELSNNLFLNLELNYKQYLNTYNKNNMNLAPFMINLQTGLTYKVQ